MNRREILKYTALATGSAICAPLLGTFITGCAKKEKEIVSVSQLHFFNEDEIQLVKAIIDTILPKTDSPSASEVNVHLDIDEVVGLAYEKKDQESYKNGFTSLKKYLEEKDFLSGNESEKKEIIIALEQSGSSESSAYLHLKQQAVAYYLSTEEVATKFLNYLPVPGEYKACIPLSEVNGKAWAL